MDSLTFAYCSEDKIINCTEFKNVFFKHLGTKKAEQCILDAKYQIYCAYVDHGENIALSENIYVPEKEEVQTNGMEQFFVKIYIAQRDSYWVTNLVEYAIYFYLCKRYSDILVVFCDAIMLG